MPIHSTAIVHPDLRLPEDVEVGPYAILDAEVELGPRAKVGPFCHLYPGTVLEEDVELSDGVIVGGPPQDLKFRGERTGARIGRRTRLREYVTVNRGTAASGLTVVGEDCLLMAYTHVGHDSVIGNRVVVANAVHMGGHVRVGEGTVISGITGVHQFVSIGPGCFIGGGLRAIKDVLPFTKGLGDPMRYGGLNPIGLEKLGFPPSCAGLLNAAYRLLAKEGKPALLAWLASAVLEAGSRGDADGKRLAELLLEWMSLQSRSLLTRTPGSGDAQAAADA
jgi:UDP-N-acetylglucosamine acyltransferase